MNDPIIFIGPQLPTGNILTLQIDSNGTTTVGTTTLNLVTGPQPAPYTVTIAPTTTLAALQAIIKGITG